MGMCACRWNTHVLIASTAPFVVRRWLAVRRRAADASATSWTVVVYDEWHNTVAALAPAAVTVPSACRGVVGVMDGACVCVARPFFIVGVEGTRVWHGSRASLSWVQPMGSFIHVQRVCEHHHLEE